MKIQKALGLGAVFAFFILGVVAIKQASPAHKEDRIYKAISVYSPYKLEKRIGGLTIVDSRTGDKEKPASADVLLRFDEVNQIWGKSHLTIEGTDLLIAGDNNQSIVKVFIKNQNERDFLKTFYGI